nr:unnamed protein product [Spirometra erinaceieuropaei]
MRISHADAATTDFLDNVESLLVTSETSDYMGVHIRSNETGPLQQSIHYHTLLIEEEKALRSLKTDDEVVVISTDNGGAIDIVNKADCVKKTNEIFDDREAYAPFVVDPAKSRQWIFRRKRMSSRDGSP